MKLFSKLVFFLFSNLVALLAAAYFVEGFEISPGFINYLTVAAILTLINVFIRPFIKLVLTPIIILTLGLGIILVNALTLYILDIFSNEITIIGLAALVYATLIVSAVNILINFSAKRIYKQ
ncbi:MAG: phage holin family protein [Candidatus Paceibacterota bacterium]